MKITLVRSMARSAVFELVNSGCYRAPAPYTVALDGDAVYDGDTNVFSLYSLEPGRSYTVAVTLDGVTDTLEFTTAEESFFVDASRCGLVADGVTDNTAKLQAALSTCPVGGTVYVPAGTYRTQSLFLQSNTTLYLEKAARCWAAPSAPTIRFCPVSSPATTKGTSTTWPCGRATPWTALRGLSMSSTPRM